MKRAAAEPVQWRIVKLAGKAKFIGHVMARDQKEALAKAFEEFAIPERERFKIGAQRD